MSKGFISKNILTIGCSINYTVSDGAGGASTHGAGSVASFTLKIVLQIWIIY